MEKYQRTGNCLFDLTLQRTGLIRYVVPNRLGDLDFIRFRIQIDMLKNLARERILVVRLKHTDRDLAIPYHDMTVKGMVQFSTHRLGDTLNFTNRLIAVANTDLDSR